MRISQPQGKRYSENAKFGSAPNTLPGGLVKYEASRLNEELWKIYKPSLNTKTTNIEATR